MTSLCWAWLGDATLETEWPTSRQSDQRSGPLYLGTPAQLHWASIEKLLQPAARAESEEKERRCQSLLAS